MNTPPLSTSPATNLPIQAAMLFASLEQSLLKATPQLPTLLADIHKLLASDAQTVTLMSDRESALLVSGLIKHTGVVLTESAAKKAAKSKPTLESLGLG